jgi:hypothetical protein
VGHNSNNVQNSFAARLWRTKVALQWMQNMGFFGFTGDNSGILGQRARALQLCHTLLSRYLEKRKDQNKVAATSKVQAQNGDCRKESRGEINLLSTADS